MRARGCSRPPHSPELGGGLPRRIGTRTKALPTEPEERQWTLGRMGSARWAGTDARTVRTISVQSATCSCTMSYIAVPDARGRCRRRTLCVSRLGRTFAVVGNACLDANSILRTINLELEPRWTIHRYNSIGIQAEVKGSRSKRLE